MPIDEMRKIRRGHKLHVPVTKKIITQEISTIIHHDPIIRHFFLQLAEEHLGKKIDETKQLTLQVESKNEDRFDRMLDELRRDREEQSKKWEEQERRWAEQKEEDRKRAEEYNARFETITRLFNQKFDSTLSAIGARWGGRSEAAFRNGLKDILKQFNVIVKRVEEFDEQGFVFDYPSQIEYDVIIYNGTLMVGEIKSSLSKSEVYTFSKKAKFYEQKHQRKPDQLFILTPMIVKDAASYAKELGIKIYSYADDFGEDITKLPS